MSVCLSVCLSCYIHVTCVWAEIRSAEADRESFAVEVLTRLCRVCWMLALLALLRIDENNVRNNYFILGIETSQEFRGMSVFLLNFVEFLCFCGTSVFLRNSAEFLCFCGIQWNFCVSAEYLCFC